MRYNIPDGREAGPTQAKLNRPVNTRLPVSMKPMSKTYLKILEELGWPMIYLVPVQQYEHIDGDSAHGLYGISSDFQPVISVNKKTPDGKPLLGRTLKNTYYHEILHHLFPSWKHWKVYLAAYVLAKGGGDWMRKEYYGHTIDEIGPRDKLLRRVRLAVERFNRRLMNGA